MFWKQVLIFLLSGMHDVERQKNWSGLVVAEWCANEFPHFGCKCESPSSEVFLSFSVVARTHLSASMQ